MTTSTATAEKTPAGLLHRYGETLERHLEERLQAGDENLDGLWRGAQQTVREYVMRPAKRVRPTLLTLGWLMARPQDAQVEPPAALLDFGMGLELLHAFMLVHDDVADRSPMRRGGPSLHAALGGGKLGDDLAVIAGDHLYARAVELLLAGGVDATRYIRRTHRPG